MSLAADSDKGRVDIDPALRHVTPSQGKEFTEAHPGMERHQVQRAVLGTAALFEDPSGLLRREHPHLAPLRCGGLTAKHGFRDTKPHRTACFIAEPKTACTCAIEAGADVALMAP